MELYGENISSRLLLGTAQYPSPAKLTAAIKSSGTDIVTVSLRRETAAGKTGTGTGSGFLLFTGLDDHNGERRQPDAIRRKRP